MKSILVIEDDLLLLEGIKDLLELDGYQVHTASDGLKALEVLSLSPPDLVVIDLMMPRMNGLELYRQVRHDPALISVPFIFIGANRTSWRDQQLMGDNICLNKPFEPEELRDAVAKSLKITANKTSMSGCEG